jgi:hypothetical protein
LAVAGLPSSFSLYPPPISTKAFCEIARQSRKKLKKIQDCREVYHGKPLMSTQVLALLKGEVEEISDCRSEKLNEKAPSPILPPKLRRTS